MKPIILLITTILLLLLTTCKKDDPPCTSCPHDDSLEELYDWLYFKEGTYWIYEEESSGALDTVEVYFSWIGDSGGWPAFEYYSYSTHFDYDFRYRFSDSFSSPCVTSESCACKRVERSKTRPGDFVGANKVFHVPGVLGDYAYLVGGGGQMIVSERFDSLSVLNNTYQTVTEYHITVDQTEDDYESIYSVSKHYGIIKREIIDLDEVWNLKEFEIIQ